jgi:hypothetical protein
MSTTEPDQSILGYDARESWMSFATTWSEQRKKGFLYRLDLVKPLSVDVNVWPSIFDSEKVATPDRFGFQTTWNNFSGLSQALTRACQKNPLKGFRVVAITLLLGIANRDDSVPWEERVPPVEPAARGDDWALLGYDVADQWMLSALMNCGFLPGEDVDRLRREWGPLLNQFHLFTDVASALAFKQMSDKRLANDHAPCFVYGIWTVKSV